MYQKAWDKLCNGAYGNIEGLKDAFLAIEKLAAETNADVGKFTTTWHGDADHVSEGEFVPFITIGVKRYYSEDNES